MEEKRAAELIIAIKKLAFQNEEKEKRAASDYITKPVKTDQLLSLMRVLLYKQEMV